MARISTALAELDADASRVDVAVITIDPTVDTAQVLADWVTSFVPTGRALRTDDPAKLRTVADRLLATYVVDHTAPTTSTAGGHPGQAAEVGHTGYVYVVDANGQNVLIWPQDVRVDDMVNDLHILLDRLPDAMPAGA